MTHQCSIDCNSTAIRYTRSKVAFEKVSYHLSDPCPLVRIRAAIALLRRGSNKYGRFLSDLRKNIDVVTEFADARFLISVCDTIADHDTTRADKALVLATLGHWEHMSLMSRATGSDRKHTELWSGCYGAGDIPDIHTNLAKRMSAMNDSLISSLLQAMMQKISKSETLVGLSKISDDPAKAMMKEQKQPNSLGRKFNFVIIVLDSCRYDSYAQATAKNINKNFRIVEAKSMAQFTFPAHMAMFQGFFPSTNTKEALYNRFVMSPYRWDYQPKPALITVPRKIVKNSDITIVKAFQNSGFTTAAVGGVHWFGTHNPMSIGFDHFIRARPSSEPSSIDIFKWLYKEPFYGVLNFAETHAPYTINNDKTTGPSSGNCYDSVYDPDWHQRQINAVEKVDEHLESVFEKLKESSLPTLVVVCADHGDCMGEDGCYGHGFAHDNVLSVPLGWSFVFDGDFVPVTAKSLERFDVESSAASI